MAVQKFASGAESSVVGRTVYTHAAGDNVKETMADARNPIHFALTAQGLVRHLAAL